MIEKENDSKLIDEELYTEFSFLKERLLKINMETEKVLKKIDTIYKNHLKI